MVAELAARALRNGKSIIELPYRRTDRNEPTREFIVEVDLVAEMAVFNPFDFFLEPYAEKFPLQQDLFGHRQGTRGNGLVYHSPLLRRARKKP